VEQTVDGIFVSDAQGHYLDVNSAGAAMLGYTPAEIRQLSITDVITDEELPRLPLEIARFADGRVITSEWQFRRRDGSLFPGEVVGRQLPNCRLQAILRDITERKRAEAELRQAHGRLEMRVQERTADLSRVVATLNEEVARRSRVEQTLRERSEQMRKLASELTLAEQRERQRLALILHDGLQQVLVGAKFRLALVDRSVNVQQAKTEVSELIDDAIEISRSLTAELSPPILRQGDLIAALEWLARWVRRKYDLNVHLTAHEMLGPMSEDVIVLLFQGTRELLFNVVKHAGVKAATIDVNRLGDGIQLTVEDKGVGFDPSQLRSEGGSSGGVGLFSIRERLSILGGWIETQSTPGRGSRIKLVAPDLAAAGQADRQPAEASAKVSVATFNQSRTEPGDGERQIRVLLVDDHMVMRQGLSGLLRAEPGIEISGEASDGESAVMLARELRPDVVLMDINMPGMDGIQATRIIHGELPEIRIIGLSLFQESERGAAMLEAGAISYLTKSGPSEAVIAAIRACAGIQ
jgi:PAS domain S-box-containing protein